jgi:NADPH-dependent ferric siderophore reductase
VDDKAAEMIRMSQDIQRLARAVPSRPAGDLDDEHLLAKAHGSARWSLTVMGIVRIAPRMLRITLSGSGIETMNWRPAQDLTLLITRVAGRDIRRRYTIAGQEHDQVHLDVYLHGHGMGSAWAGALRPGDTVSAIGPRGKLLLNPDAEWHVLIGDETSLPGIHAMLAATDAPAQVVVEVDDPAQWQPLGPRGRAQTCWTWLSRGPSINGQANVSLPRSGNGQAYVTGEASRVLAWCDELELLGLDRSAIAHKAYWGTGRVNATHGEPLA